MPRLPFFSLKNPLIPHDVPQLFLPIQYSFYSPTSSTQWFILAAIVVSWKTPPVYFLKVEVASTPQIRE